MKCPHCGYEHGFNCDENKDIAGKDGDFFKLTIEMKQQRDWYPTTKNLYACPKCKIAFID
jgi:hypothetical protein